MTIGFDENLSLTASQKKSCFSSGGMRYVDNGQRADALSSWPPYYCSRFVRNSTNISHEMLMRKFLVL